MQDSAVKYAFSSHGSLYKNNKLYTKIERKETDIQNFLHINSENPITVYHIVTF